MRVRLRRLLDFSLLSDHAEYLDVMNGLDREDADFESTERTFYFVRVIEIPKPRWTAYDQRFFDLEMSDEVPMTMQDRAYTSPIWYTP